MSAASTGRSQLEPWFELIVPTLGRPELVRLLRSLEAQTHRAFHVTIVDQSGGDGVASLVESFSTSLSLRRMVSSPGAAAARDAGLRVVAARLDARDVVVGFPDDDCWYPPTLLSDVAARLRARSELDGVTGRVVTERLEPSSARWDMVAGSVDRKNVWRRAIAFSIFVRLDLARSLDGFDLTLGPGASSPWGAGEETEFLIRALDSGARIWYDPALVVFHPEKRYGGRDSRRVACGYARGMTRVLRLRGYSRAYVAMVCLRPLGGVILFLVKGRPRRAAYHLALFRGRVAGALERTP